MPGAAATCSPWFGKDWPNFALACHSKSVPLESLARGARRKDRAVLTLLLELWSAKRLSEGIARKNGPCIMVEPLRTWQPRTDRVGRTETSLETMLRQLAILSVLLTALLLSAAEEDSALSFRLAGSFYYGAADGFLQTPAGGQPGSSSARRPTLEELNINDAVFYDALALVHWRRLGLYAGLQAISLDGRAVLSDSLVSRNVTFPSGTPVHAETDLNWARMGTGWKFEMADRRVELFPKIEFAVLDFSYALAGGGQAVERSYAKGCLRLGLEATYRFNRLVSVNLDGGASAPISNTPQIATLVGTVQFDLQPGGRVRPTLFVGGGAQRIEYEDNQALPNHFRVDVAPFVAAGLAISF